MEIVVSIYLMIELDMIQLISTVLGIVASICTILAYYASKRKK